MQRFTAILKNFPVRLLVFPIVVMLLGATSFAANNTVSTQESPQPEASELIEVQAKPKVIPRVLQKATQNNTSIYISLKKQRAWFFVDQEVAIETPISSGKQSAMTPKGAFTVLERNDKHESNLYGAFVDHAGHTIRKGVSSKLDSAPSGTTFRVWAMPYYLRINTNGVALHGGYLPGYPAAHSNVRFPEEIARMIFENSKVGTPVTIAD